MAVSNSRRHSVTTPRRMLRSPFSIASLHPNPGALGHQLYKLFAQAAQRLLNILLGFEHIREEQAQLHLLQRARGGTQPFQRLIEAFERLLLQGLKALQMLFDEAQTILAALADQRAFRQISLLATALGEWQQDAGTIIRWDDGPFAAPLDLIRCLRILVKAPLVFCQIAA